MRVEKELYRPCETTPKHIHRGLTVEQQTTVELQPRFIGTITLPVPDYDQFITQYSTKTFEPSKPFLSSFALARRFSNMPSKLLNTPWSVYQFTADKVSLVAHRQLSVDELHGLTTVVAPSDFGRIDGVLDDWQEMVKPETDEGRYLYELHAGIAGLEPWKNLLLQLEQLLPMYQHSVHSIKNRYLWNFRGALNEQNECKALFNLLDRIKTLLNLSDHEKQLFRLKGSETVEQAAQKLLLQLAELPFKVFPTKALYSITDSQVSFQQLIENIHTLDWSGDGFIIIDPLGTCFFVNTEMYHMESLVTHETVPTIPLVRDSEGKLQLDLFRQPFNPVVNEQIATRPSTNFFSRVRQELINSKQLTPELSFSTVAGLCGLYALDPELLLPILPITHMQAQVPNGTETVSQTIGQAQVPLLLMMKNMPHHQPDGSIRHPQKGALSGQLGSYISAQLEQLLS